MFGNAKIYNETGSVIYNMAERMITLVKKETQFLRQALRLQKEEKKVATPRDAMSSSSTDSLPLSSSTASLSSLGGHERKHSVSVEEEATDDEEEPPLKRQKM